MTAHHHPAIRARSLANIVADLREARSDHDQALTEIREHGDDADDRASAAETRCEDLREELHFVFARTNGMPLERLLKCVEEGVL